MNRDYKFDINPWNVIVGLLIFVVLFLGVFWLARMVFRLLMFLSPFLIIGAAILDYKVIVGYFRWLGMLLKRNTPMGIAAILLSAVGFPLVSAFWFGRALMNYRNRKAQRQEAGEPLELGEYIDFEEIKQREKRKIKQARGGDELDGIV